ncbi:hypothetical protein [Pseudomonas sp. BP8]|uniref:hypothetical protein n=1 Tax=Pseudomonas sp. BP8 TaxID=2817864 RepID=UPI001AE2052F|nr:hypothetical protein [Pseudomonas sp. BP8]MBP2260275.1 hypothetical protein [Pseudomonas sp. BP8]HDS1733920.1 hypothetical protein [Pseudomonas putida]
MQLSIRDASRFVIGAGLMRQKAIEASNNPAISFDNVAQAALRDTPDSQKIRQTIDALADQEAQWLRNTPPHTLSSDRVMQSRKAEVNAFTAIHRAVVSAVSFEAASPDEKDGEQSVLRQSLLDALEAIDNTSGSRADREGLLANLRDQVVSVSSDGDFMKGALRDSEQAYLAADLDKTFARYNTPSLQRSADLDDYSL